MRKLLFALLVTTSACTLGPDYERPNTALPEKMPWSENEKTKISAEWWKEFNDPKLSTLVAEGLTANADLAIAAARVSQARATLDYTYANQFPELDYQANASRAERSIQSSFGGNTPTSVKPYNTFGLAAVLNYEINLWGKLQRASEVARAQLVAQEANRDAIRLAITSEIAVGYFNLRAIDEQITITENTVKSRQNAFEYQDKQYKGGIVDGLTLKQSESELAAAQAQLPILQQAKQEQETALAVLLGRSPKDLVEKTLDRGEELDKLPIPPILPSNLPSDLMLRRPDIIAAEQNLIAANANIGYVRADYFPTISLSALLGLESSQAERLLRASANNWNYGAALAGPLLDFGRTNANVDEAEAQKDEALANYSQTVRLAFKDVLDSMKAQQTSNDRVIAQTAQVNASAESVRLAGLRYDSGYSSYLEVLDAQRSLYAGQLDSVIAKRDRLIATVNLYKSLGGGWVESKKNTAE